MARSEGGAAPDPGLRPDALSEVYAAQWAGLVRLATLLLRDQGRAEEVVQDAFVAAYPRLPRLREAGTAGAYLRRSVVNGCRSAYRHAGVELRYVAGGAGGSAAGADVLQSAEGTAVARDAAAALLARVRALPLRQREVLVLRYYADLTEQQTADALGISAGSVKTHAHRALAALRDQLAGKDDDE